MFCEEPIIAGYDGFDMYGNGKGESFFDLYHDIAYHVTEGCRMVLETANFYISLDVSGVQLLKKKTDIQEIIRPGEDLDSFIHEDAGEVPWVDYEFTLFAGQRLHSVEEQSGQFLLKFDDFEMKLVPHPLGEKDFPSFCDHRKDHWSYNHVFGAERLLKRKCHCGGEGELLLDFVSDYVVRCKSCKKSTYAEMMAKDAIAEWNAGCVQCDLFDIVIE